ncbi:MAG: cell division protein SepF [Oscillospiraceae bacterium]|nr:cell division protein SepF [Oscillospiraceae bacterium]
MGFVNKLKGFFYAGSEDEYENDEEYIAGRNDIEEEQGVRIEPETTSRKNKVVNINTTTQLRVVLVKPERFADASTIADHLNSKRTVVLNLESTNKEVSRRLVDFLSGVAYANNGEMKRVANSTYIITPFNVDIVGDLLDELESSGAFLQ